MQLLTELSGKSLLDLIVGGYFNSIYPELVSNSVEMGLKKVEIFFGNTPNVYGSNISAFKTIRDTIYKISNGNSIINSFIIAVPHTHWEGHNPVIYKYDNDSTRYLIGHHAPDVKKIYYPVSFVFSEESVLPYEWLGYSASLPDLELEEAYDLLKLLHSEIASTKWPLGINIDFRFKESLSESSVPTVEIPLEEETLENFAFIQKYSEYVLAGSQDHTEQVAWSAVSEMSYDLTPKELNILRAIRSQLSELPSDEEREKFLRKHLT